MQVKAVSGWHDPRVRSKPVAPLSEYEQWFMGRNRQKTQITPQQVRRAVIMRKQGETWKDCGYAVGRSGGALKEIIEFLPINLQP